MVLPPIPRKTVTWPETRSRVGGVVVVVVVVVAVVTVLVEK